MFYTPVVPQLRRLLVQSKKILDFLFSHLFQNTNFLLRTRFHATGVFRFLSVLGDSRTVNTYFVKFSPMIVTDSDFFCICDGKFDYLPSSD